MKIQQNYSHLIQQRLKLSQIDINKICEEWNIRKLSLFGSILREDFDKASLLDIIKAGKKVLQFSEAMDQKTLAIN